MEDRRKQFRAMVQAQTNFTDPEAKIMKCSNKGFDYCYNAQAVVDSAHQIIVAAETTAAATPPWYLDGDNLDAENQHYFATANASNSWRPAGKSLTAPYL